MANNITKIPPTSKIKVYWDDKPHNYSPETKTKIRNQIAKKYGVDKNSVSVLFRGVKVDEKGDVVEISGAGIENIMDVNYQRSLMKELLLRDDNKVDFNRIVALDDKVNGELSLDMGQSTHRTWSMRWIMIDNFLSYGEKNFIPFSKIKGLTIVNSIPSNQGGKTTLTVDAFMFLLFGKTTKTDTNEEIFNQYTDKDELVVRGMIDIEGKEVIIERKVTRKPKKGGTYTVSSKVNYYEILPDGEEQALNDENSVQTTKLIKETIGTDKDFEMLVLATENNLDDLIGLTNLESGKVLTRLIGLEVLEHKERVVRDMYNEFAKKKKSKEYDVVTLNDDILEHKERIVVSTELSYELDEKLENSKKEIIKLNTSIEDYITSKEKIDVVITEMNPSKLESDVKELTDKGIGLKNKSDVLKVELGLIGEVIFDEDLHFSKTKLFNEKNTTKALKESDVKRLEKVVVELVAGGICDSCNRKLDDVDNTAHIAKHEAEIMAIKAEIVTIIAEISELDSELFELGKKKKLVDDKNKIELNIDRADVEMGSLRNDIISKRNDLKKYKLNLEGIEFNKKIDVEISRVKSELSVQEHTRDKSITNIQVLKNNIETDNTHIENKTRLVETIKKEEDVDKIFKIYIDLVGKKGISKLVLRSVLPIINSEVARLLDEIVDFNVEVFINEKNDVQFHLIKDGVTKKLKSGSGLEKTASSLALRAVLGKLSTLPMPNFITFDEILGKIAAENMDVMKNLFDRIKDMYEIVFFITHNDVVKDWGENMVTVIKTNNVSKVTIK